MGRVINTQAPGKLRQGLIKSIVIAIRELAGHNEINAEVKDLNSFIALALCSIAETTESTTSAWEKRGYWLKADKFRLEWLWAEEIGNNMKSAILAEKWEDVVLMNLQIAQHLNNTKVPNRKRIGSPWKGSFERLVVDYEKRKI